MSMPDTIRWCLLWLLFFFDLYLLEKEVIYSALGRWWILHVVLLPTSQHNGEWLVQLLFLIYQLFVFRGALFWLMNPNRFSFLFILLKPSLHFESQKIQEVTYMSYTLFTILRCLHEGDGGKMIEWVACVMRIVFLMQTRRMCRKSQDTDIQYGGKDVEESLNQSLPLPLVLYRLLREYLFFGPTNASSPFATERWGDEDILEAQRIRNTPELNILKYRNSVKIEYPLKSFPYNVVMNRSGEVVDGVNRNDQEGFVSFINQTWVSILSSHPIPHRCDFKLPSPLRGRVHSIHDSCLGIVVVGKDLSYAVVD